MVWNNFLRSALCLLAAQESVGNGVYRQVPIIKRLLNFKSPIITWKWPFCPCFIRCPTMEPFFCQNITAISRLLPLEFWCSEGHFTQFDLILTLFWPILTCFDLFRRADLTYSHLFRPIRRADLTYFHLFRPISFHNKAPWTGHLSFTRHFWVILDDP